MSKRKNHAETSGQLMGVVAIFVVAIFVVGVIIIFAKSLFSGVEADVPQGLDTATQAHAQAVSDTQASDEGGADSKQTKAKANESKKKTTTTKAQPQTMTVVEYAYLRVEPSPEGEGIICMSPGIVVNILSEVDENGYVKASFDNNGEMLEGWVHTDYLQ